MREYPEEPLVCKAKEQHWWLPTRWVLNEDYSVRVSYWVKLVIPFGFEFETSIPRLLWPLIAPTGTLFKAGMVHDFGYRRDPGNRTRKYWDELFYKLAQQEADRPFAHRVAYLGVRVGGWNAWRKYRRNDK